jgi:hypothetical protein
MRHDKSNATHKSYSFAAEVVKDQSTGRRRLGLLAKKYYDYIVDRKLGIGNKVTIIITDKKPKRSERQNNYYWGAYLPLIAESSGHTVDELHARFKSEFLDTSVGMVYKKETKVQGSTSELTIGAFIEYILNIEQLTGIPAPPTENYDLPTLHN